MLAAFGAGLVPRLVESSLVGGVLAVLVWAVCRAVPSLPSALRCWLWWGVALKMLVGLLPLPAVALPVMPARDFSSAFAVATWQTDGMSPASLPASGARRSPAVEGSAKSNAADSAAIKFGAIEQVAIAAPTIDRASQRSTSSFPWLASLGVLWLLGVAVELARAAIELLRARAIARAAEPVDDPALLATFEELRRRLAIPAAALRLSRAVATPQLVGILRPVILLPNGVRERLDAEGLAMVLGHELLHVRRGDLLRGLIPALAARCFFFHPLVRLAEREHSLAREEACDAAVVARLAPSPRAYGRLLLELALGCGEPLRAAAAAVTHPTLQRRLEMLLRPASRVRPVLASSLLLLGLCALVPLRLVARGDAATTAAPAVAATTAHASEPFASASATTVAEVRSSAAAAEATAAPTAAHVQLASIASTAVSASQTRAALAAARASDGWNDDDDAWMLLHDRDSSTMNGSVEDIERVRERYQRGDEPLLWVRRDGKEWIVRDPALLRRAEELFAPMRELGAKQADLGAKQAELGARQANLGAKQAELGSQQAQLGSQQAALSAQMAQLSAQQAALSARMARAERGERERLHREQEQLERAMDRLDDQMHALSQQQQELGGRQGELGGHQGELGGKQGELGEMQAELGRLQQKASEEAGRGLAELIDEAIRAGLAVSPP